MLQAGIHHLETKEEGKRPCYTEQLQGEQAEIQLQEGQQRAFGWIGQSTYVRDWKGLINPV